MNKRFNAVVVTLVAVLVSALAVAAQQSPAKPAAPASGDSRLFPLADVRAGMKGVGHTVFVGSEPQEFGVEILGVIDGYPNPRQSAIIAKLSGANVAKTRVFAGMSGSPVFIDGRLVGAVAFT
jgi:hypothetical protein